MNRFPLILIIFAFLQNCTSLKSEIQNGFEVSHGVVVQEIDKNLNDSIMILKFESREGIVFPERYAKELFKNSFQRYFTPSKCEIIEAETELEKQYCQARKAFWNYRKLQNLEDFKNDRKELKEILNYYKKREKLFTKNCPKRQIQLINCDRQFLGFYNNIGEKIIRIQIIDFSQDPYKLKNLFYKSWIDGWHGWFETNVDIMHFNLNTNKLTVNDDV